MFSHTCFNLPIVGSSYGFCTLNPKMNPFGALLLALLGVVFAPLAFADDEASVQSDSPFDYKFYLGVGVGIEKFDTNFKFTDKATGRDVFLDAEDDLGLPETKTIPMIYGVYRPSTKHGFGFSFFRINRESTLLDIDKSLGDLRVKGDVTLSDKTRFYYASYNYTLFDNDRTFVFASLGVYGLDLKYQLAAQGELSIRDIPIKAKAYEESVNQFAPLPLIGIDVWHALTPKWLLSAKLSVVGGSYQEVSAFVYQSRIRVRYRFSERTAFSFGVNYLDADIEIDQKERIIDIGYGFSGAILGFDFRF